MRRGIIGERRRMRMLVEGATRDRAKKAGRARGALAKEIGGRITLLKKVKRRSREKRRRTRRAIPMGLEGMERRME